MDVVVAAASPGSPEFAVIDFSNTPPTVVMVPGFENGNVVDCYGTVAVVAGYSGDSVALFDISTPASPVQIGSVTTGFQIGSISTNGAYVLTGEYNGSRVTLIDSSNPASPSIVSVSDCAPLLNIISNVALRGPATTALWGPTAVVSGNNNSVALYFEDPPAGAVPAQILYNATGPSDFDGWTAAVAAVTGLFAYTVSGNISTELTKVPYSKAFSTVAVAEIPAGGYFVAVGGVGSFTLFAYPSSGTMGSITYPLQKGMTSIGTVVKFLNNPAIAPFLAVANVTAGGVYISYFFIQVETGGSGGTIVSFFMPIPVIQAGLATTFLPTLGITAFTPKWKFWPFPWPVPKWLEGILRALGF